MSLLGNLEFILADLSILISGFLIGVIVTAFGVSFLLKFIRISTRLKNTKASAVKFKDDSTGEEIIYINPGTFQENVILFYKLMLIKVTNNKYVRIRNTTKDAMMYRVVVVVTFLLLLYATAQTINIQE